jgi:hypothetical protein
MPIRQKAETSWRIRLKAAPSVTAQSQRQRCAGLRHLKPAPVPPAAAAAAVGEERETFHPTRIRCGSGCFLDSRMPGKTSPAQFFTVKVKKKLWAGVLSTCVTVRDVVAEPVHKPPHRRHLKQ